MAGEIQLNSTTMATESSGTITLSNVDSATNRTNLGLGSMATQNANAVAITGGTINTVQPATGQSLTIKDEDGNTAITIGTDNTAAGYLSLNFGSYHGSSGGAGSGTLSGNTLNDYETGTWTPSIIGATLSGGSVSGSYTKVGRLVSLTAEFTGVTISSVSGFSYITGFPFTSSATSVGNMAHTTMTSIGQARLGSAGSSAILTPLNTTGATGQWNAGSSKYMTFQITYHAS
jgi:hypothetical protein